MIRLLVSILVVALIAGVVTGFGLAIAPDFGPRVLGEGYVNARTEDAFHSMADWVGAADLIVDGTILSVVDVGLITGWADDGSLATVTPSISGEDDPTADWTASLIDVTVRVDELYKDTSQLIVPGQTIIVRTPAMDGFYWAGNCPAGLPTLSDPYDTIGHASGTSGSTFLYALVPNLDGASWVTPGAHLGQLSMSGSEVMSSGCPPAKIEFTNNVSPTAFIAEMVAEIAKE